MIATAAWIGTTRLGGVVLCALVALCCWLAWVQAKRSGQRLWSAVIVGAAEVFLAIDGLFGWRWRLHDSLAHLAERWNVYAYRRLPQAIALLLTLASLLVVSRFVTQRWRRRPGRVAVLLGSLLSVMLWLAEVISLHWTDMVLYHPVGPVRVISFLWAAVWLMTSLGILKEGRFLATRRAK
jgi:hypothetical protein